MDKVTLSSCASATGGRIITVEDHYPEGGLGGAVAETISDIRGKYSNPIVPYFLVLELTVNFNLKMFIGIVHKRLAVTGIPRSGTTDELLSLFKIDAEEIVKAVHELLTPV